MGESSSGETVLTCEDGTSVVLRNGAPGDTVYVGDYTVSSAGEAQTLAHFTVITGALTFESAELADLHYPKLHTVGGNLGVYANANLTRVSFPLLETVGGGSLDLWQPAAG